MIAPDANLNFTRFTPEYLANVLFMETNSYPEPWTQGMFRQELENPNSYIYLAFKENVLIGYGGFWLVLDEAHITRVTVSEKFRKNGYGLLIMEYLLENAFQLGAVLARLEVRENNLPARKLYDKMGFVTEGRRLGYYQRTNEHAVLMVKRF